MRTCPKGALGMGLVNYFGLDLKRTEMRRYISMEKDLELSSSCPSIFYLRDSTMRSTSISIEESGCPNNNVALYKYGYPLDQLLQVSLGTMHSRRGPFFCATISDLQQGDSGSLVTDKNKAVGMYQGVHSEYDPQGNEIKLDDGILFDAVISVCSLDQLIPSPENRDNIIPDLINPLSTEINSILLFVDLVRASQPSAYANWDKERIRIIMNEHGSLFFTRNFSIIDPSGQNCDRVDLSQITLSDTEGEISGIEDSAGNIETWKAITFTSSRTDEDKISWNWEQDQSIIDKLKEEHKN